MDLYISHDKSKRLNIYLFGLFFYTSIRIKERVVNLMIKFGKGVVKHRVLILIVAFALLIPSGISFINTRINFDILSYLPSQIETMKGQDIMVDEFGTGALSFVILEDMKDQDIETLADDIEDLKGVNDVIWYGTIADSTLPREAIPDEVSVRGHEEKNYNCTVDFSKEYYDLTAAQEVLLRASVVRTLTQLDSISYVTFTVNSIPLVDSDDEIVGSMGADDFVENPGEQINTSVKETLTLYFADKDGTGLEKQTRVIHYSSNIALEKLVVEQLIEGPKGSKLKATLPGATKLINVSVADRICYLNFDSSFRNTIDNKLTEDVVLYSIVNSLTSLPTVDKVQISLDGENDGMLLYNYKLSDMYEFNKDIVDSDDSTEKTEK